jgi:alpha-L-fucosidase
VQQVLLAVGGWLKVNGDAIYGARQWKVYGEGPTKVAAGSFHDTETRPYTAEDFRFTTKGPVLLRDRTCLANQRRGSHTIAWNLISGGGGRIQAIFLLGSDAKLAYQQRADGLHIQLPAKPVGDIAYAFRITLDNAAQRNAKAK